MSTYFVQGSTMDAIADAINAKTGGSSAMTPAQMVTAIGTISGGGAAITDGIVVTARDSGGYATAATLYGTVVQPQQFWNRVATDGTWKNLSALTFADSVVEVKGNAFAYCYALESISLPSVNTIRGGAFLGSGLISAIFPELSSAESSAFMSCGKLQTISLPKLTNLQGQLLRGCSAMQTSQIGSVGYTVTASQSNAFQGCTQTGLTITIYTTGTYVDTLVSSIRNGATNATIIFKASEATTYNGTAYAAGDTILTSEVTP